MPTLEQRIERGIRALDKVRPGWHWRIDVEKIDIKFSGLCILGQVFGDYNDVIMSKNDKRCYDFGFLPNCQVGKDWSDFFPLQIMKYNRAWKKAIIEKRKREDYSQFISNLPLCERFFKDDRITQRA